MAAQTILHYRILSKIGVGGMGEVYLAEDTRLERRVAIKVLPEEFTRDEGGDVALARKAYEDFFALWKDADPDTPVLKEARTEYEKLKQGGS